MIMEASVGAGFIKVVDFNEVYKFLADRLQRDCYYLLARPPAFRPGQIPTDGDTGERQEVKK